MEKRKIMFRKLKSKTFDNSGRNIRQRIDEEGDIQVKSTNGEATLNVDDNESLSFQPILPKYTGLSFNEDEGDDLVGFRLKKNQHRSNEANEKTLRKQKILAARAERLKSSTVEDITVKREDKSNGVEDISKNQNIPELEKLRQIESQKFSQGIVSIDSMEDVREAFPTSFDGIPDAKAVYEARKKREILRQVGATSATGNNNSGDFIPLDDTVRLKGNRKTGERSRLIREDENDMSDEDEGGRQVFLRFYSAKKLLQTEEDVRREEQANFLSMEQGSSDEDNDPSTNGRKYSKKPKKTLGGNKKISDAEEEEEEDDELQRWESEQIRKGVSSNKVIQMRNELAATNLYFNEDYSRLQKEGGGEVEMDIEVDLQILDVHQQNTQTPVQKLDSSTIPEISNTKSNVSFEQLLDGLQQRLAEKKEIRDAMEFDLKRIKGQIEENTDSIHKLEHCMPQLESKFKMFQNIRVYTRDLLDCLNEKCLHVNALEERVSEMWKQRTERLIKRRRQDVQDQYERCAANAAGRSFMLPNVEFAQRETEREARRNRRRIQRANQRITSTLPGQSLTPNNTHFEGLSSDDEETQSQQVFYEETICSIEQSATDLFLDTEEDFCQIQGIVDRIINWLAIDEDSFNNAYVSLCLPKLLGPFIRLQMLSWRPLQNDSLPLHSFPWYKQLLTTGLDNSGLESIEHPFLVQLIPNVVEKVVFSTIARIINEQWDPLSLSESTNLATLLHSLVDDYPISTANSKRMNEILNGLITRIRNVLENDTFVPLYSKDAIEAVETGCSVFMDRQFWKSLKIMRSVLCFRGILSDSFLEELVMEGLVNRCVVMSLQFSVITNPTIIPKCMALSAQIPVDWLLPKKHHSSNTYRPLEVLLKQAIEAHRHRDRKFAEKMQNFVNLLSSTPFKQENVEEE